MKNTRIFITTLAIAIASTAFSQLTANFGVGYHTGAFGNSEIGYSQSTDADGNTTYKTVNQNLGGGIPITLGIGYGITDNIALDANFEYLFGRSVVGYEDETPNSSDKFTITSNQIRFVPSLIFRNGLTGFYGRVGAVVDLGGNTIIENKSEATGAFAGSRQEKSEMTVRPSFGAVGGIGYNLSLGDNLTFFGELQALAIYRDVKKQVITEYSDSDGGTLETEYPTTRDRETEYVDEYTTGGNVNDDEPRQTTRFQLPYSSFGLNVGIRFTLNN